MAQAVAFFTGFETGGISEIGTAGTSVTVQTTNVRTGGYSLKCAAATSNQLMATGIGGTQMVNRFYVFLTGNPAGGGNLWIEQGTSGTNRLVLQISAARKLTIADAGLTMGLATVNGTTVLNTSQWYRIEVICDLAAGGVVQLLIDGVSEASTTHSSNVAGLVFNRFLLNGDTTNPIYYDDYRIDTGGVAAIGAGQVIARQGITGTPTFNSWNKGIAATATLCWSETPFSTTNACSTATTSIAQTMIVGLFSTDPGRAVEGTQVIGAGDTINAVRVSAVAKISSTTSQSQSLRRRVGGVNTDTAITLTTSDAYYQMPIFTDTAANLDAYEIGAITGATGAGSRSIEDMWMMVDYSVVTNTADTLNLAQLILTSNALTETIALPEALNLAQLILTSKALTEAIAMGDALNLAQVILTSYAVTSATSNVAEALGLAQLILTSNAVTEAIAMGDALNLAQVILTSNAVTEAIAMPEALSLARAILTSYALTDVAVINEADALNLARLILTSKPLTEAIRLPEALATAMLLLKSYGVGEKLLLPKAPLVNHKARNEPAALGKARVNQPSLSQPYSVSLRKTRNNDPELDQ